MTTFKTDSCAHYYHSANLNRILLIHPLMNHFLELYQDGIDPQSHFESLNGGTEVEGYGFFSAQEIAYYLKKFKMMADNGYFSQPDFKTKLSGRLNADMVRQSLANTMQLVLETTDACNLNCDYCGYGKFYNGYDPRNNRMLNAKTAMALMDYLVRFWNSPLNQSHKKKISVGFYGGEPLLNFPLIEEVVAYAKKLPLRHHEFSFNMTTNGTLLKKHMKFLVEHDFLLSISLDGNEQNNGYRVFHNGGNCFDSIMENLSALRREYPDYFERNVNFATVLHSKNSVADIHKFFKQNFGKIPLISEVNYFGVLPEMRETFMETYRNFSESLKSEENSWEIEKDMISMAPDSRGAADLIREKSGFVFKSYGEMLASNKKRRFIPTATCLPFARKLFLTVNGKLMPCERIDQKHAFGHADENGVTIDFQLVADTYNRYFDNLAAQCSACFNNKNCSKCIFQIDNIDNNDNNDNTADKKAACDGFMSKSKYSGHLSKKISHLEAHPEIYRIFMKEINVQ